MLSPVHLQFKKSEAGNFNVSWIRRGSVNADSWGGVEIPFDAFEEKYCISILDAEGLVKREAYSISPSFSYTNQMYVSDFGSGNPDFIIAVAQLSNSGISGSYNKIKITNT